MLDPLVVLSLLSMLKIEHLRLPSRPLLHPLVVLSLLSLLKIAPSSEAPLPTPSDRAVAPVAPPLFQRIVGS